MAIELRPGWCLSEDQVEGALELGGWKDSDGAPAFEFDGDSWRPGQALVFEREVEPLVDPGGLRRELGLVAGQMVGLAVRWSCRSTAIAGTHVGGPEPIPLDGPFTLRIEVPADVAGSIEVETCLVSRWTTDQRPVDAAPDGALIWSDGWEIPSRDRSVLLEGDELRIPVRTVSFAERYGSAASALWAIELDTRIELDDLLSNVVTVNLNRDVLGRDYPDADGEADPSRLPDALLAGISADLIRSMTAAVLDDLDGGQDWADWPEGSVGSLVLLRLMQAFGSVKAGADAYENDQPIFNRCLNDLLAPDSWKVSK